MQRMDELRQRLRADAGRIEAGISPQLDARIEASLRAVTPVARSRRRLQRWWPAVAATAVAVVVALVVGVDRRAPQPVVVGHDRPAGDNVLTIRLEDRAEELLDPLAQEYDNLQADLETARRLLRKDLGL